MILKSLNKCMLKWTELVRSLWVDWWEWRANHIRLRNDQELKRDIQNRLKASNGSTSHPRRYTAKMFIKFMYKYPAPSPFSLWNFFLTPSGRTSILLWSIKDNFLLLFSLVPFCPIICYLLSYQVQN